MKKIFSTILLFILIFSNNSTFAYLFDKNKSENIDTYSGVDYYEKIQNSYDLSDDLLNLIESGYKDDLINIDNISELYNNFKDLSSDYELTNSIINYNLVNLEYYINNLEENNYTENKTTKKYYKNINKAFDKIEKSNKKLDKAILKDIQKKEKIAEKEAKKAAKEAAKKAKNENSSDDENSNEYYSLGIWTSYDEIKNLSIDTEKSCGWYRVIQSAENADANEATIADQDSNNNMDILAAALVYSRTGEEKYKQVVIESIENLIEIGKPSGTTTLPWARETAGYVFAADLVGYRTDEFEEWLLNVAEVYREEDDGDETLLEMYIRKPNNWGSMAFGSLTAIYAYLGDKEKLEYIRDIYVKRVEGPKPDDTEYKEDISWHYDENDLRLINPKGSYKDGVDISGLMPDDMRRGDSFSTNPTYTNYPWEAIKGIVVAAIVLERQGMSIWEVGDNAIYRAVYALQVTMAENYGDEWKASGDDNWIMPFIDKAYGSDFTSEYSCGDRVFKRGKIAGFSRVTGIDLER